MESILAYMENASFVYGKIVAAGDVTGRIMIWRGFGDRTFAVDNGLLKKEDEKPGVKGDSDVDSHTTWHWHFAEVKFLLFSSDGAYLYYAGKGGVLVVWQLDTGKKILPGIGTPILRIATCMLKCLVFKHNFLGFHALVDSETTPSSEENLLL
ncbi:WD repeat-containing protein 75 [Tanacetum coccineum]